MIPALLFKPEVDRRQLPDYAMGVLCELLAASNNPDAWVDSLGRTPAQQARAMFGNLERHGIPLQRKLYRAPGNAVIDVYQRGKSQQMTHAGILDEMEDEILRLGPEHVSEHCADPTLKTVIDIFRPKLKWPGEFIARAKSDPRVANVIDEAFNSCVHLVVPVKR